LLTLNLVGEITNKRGGASQECLAQGFANSVTGFFGGMGGCAMIGQSMINVRSGW
jgi:SulP family sulfate permease